MEPHESPLADHPVMTGMFRMSVWFAMKPKHTLIMPLWPETCSEILKCNTIGLYFAKIRNILLTKQQIRTFFVIFS